MSHSDCIISHHRESRHAWARLRAAEGPLLEARLRSGAPLSLAELHHGVRMLAEQLQHGISPRVLARVTVPGHTFARALCQLEDELSRLDPCTIDEPHAAGLYANVRSLRVALANESDRR